MHLTCNCILPTGNDGESTRIAFLTGTERRRLRAPERMRPPKFTPEPVSDRLPFPGRALGKPVFPALKGFK